MSDQWDWPWDWLSSFPKYHVDRRLINCANQITDNQNNGLSRQLIMKRTFKEVYKKTRNKMVIMRHYRTCQGNYINKDIR